MILIAISLIELIMMCAAIVVVTYQAITRRNPSMWIYAIGYSIVLVLILVYHFSGGWR
jgi:hypothetical protein